MKTVFTFGRSHVEFVRAKGIDPMKVMLVVEADTEYDARNIVFQSEIGKGFCTSYPYTSVHEDFKGRLGMEENFRQVVVSKLRDDYINSSCYTSEMNEARNKINDFDDFVSSYNNGNEKLW